MLIMLRNPKNEIDFDILVPMPRNIWRGNVAARHEKAFGRENTALEWCRQNWGTKWNAYGENQVEQTDDTLTLRFQTAWNPPYPWLVAVFNFFRRDFDHNWMSEGGGAGSGKWNYKGIESDDMSIEAWAETEPEDGSPEYRRLHKLLWGVEEFTDESAA